MLNEKLFQDLNARLSELIASGPARDVEKNVRALLSGFFTRLDLVTREEFEQLIDPLPTIHGFAIGNEIRSACNRRIFV